MKEAVYEWEGHKLYFEDGHYLTDTAEDYHAIMGHLQKVQRSTLITSKENKEVRYLICDIFLRKCYRNE